MVEASSIGRFGNYNGGYPVTNNDLTPLVSAWVGQGNFGDELLAYGLRLTILDAVGPEGIDYYRAGPHPLYRGELDCRIGIHSRSDRPRLLKLIDTMRPRLEGYDALLFGGGSVLHSTNSIRWKSDLIESFCRTGTGKGAPIGGVGLSIGPFKDGAAELAAQAFLKQLDFLVVRDQASLEFAGTHMQSADIRLGRDLAFAVRDQRPALFTGDDTGRVGLSFIRDPREDADTQGQRLRAMVAIVDRLTGMGRSVRLVAMHYGAGYRDDRLHGEVWAAARRPEMIDCHVYADDVGSTLAAIAGCSHFVSMRLHGCVAAYLCGHAFLSLSRHPKAVEFCAQVPPGQGAITDLLSDPHELGTAIESLVEGPRAVPEIDLAQDAVYSGANEFLRRRLHRG